MVRWRNLGSAFALAGTLLFTVADREKPAPPPPVSQIEQMLEQLKSQYAQNEIFDLAKIANIDMSRKRLVVVYEIDDHPEAIPFRKHYGEIFKNVTKFYNEHGIGVQFVKYIPFHPERNRILLRVVDEDEYITTVPSIELYNRRSAADTEAKQRLIYYKAWASDKEFEHNTPEEFVGVSSDVLAHEIAHTLAITHVEPGEAAGQYPNLMELTYRERENCTKTGALCSAISTTQVLLMHDYLAGGQTYRAFLEAGQDIENYAAKCQLAQRTRKSIEYFEHIVDNEKTLVRKN